MPAGRVLIAGGNPLAVSPTWTRYDELGDCRCAGWELTTGRSSVFEQTDVGTATVNFHDRDGVLDTNDLVGRPIQLQIRDPVTGVWEPSFRGVIDEPLHDVNAGAPVTQVQLRCVDMFAYLARVEMLPGVHGIPAASLPDGIPEGSIYFGAGPVNDRIHDLLTQADIPDDLAMRVVFSGNVDVWDTFYDAGDSILIALRDAADAEFPGVANIYVDRHGRIVFHGRFARFDPEATEASEPTWWEFTRWKGGDEAATIADSGTAQVRGFSFNRPANLIYNTAIAWPREIDNGSGQPVPFPENQKKDQVYLDSTSRGAYGYRAMAPMGDLIIWKHKTDVASTGEVECQKFAEYFVENYKLPRKHVSEVTFKSVHPDDPRAAATWALLTRIDISDGLNLTIPQGGVSDADYFVEGIRKTVTALGPDFDLVEVTPNLTPADRYANNPFLDA